MNLRYLLKIVIYYTRDISRIIPRKKNKWVFGEKDRFRDNPKYLFYSVNKYHPEINAIWIAKDRNDVRLLRMQGYKAYYWSSPIALFHCATAKVWISGHDVRNISPIFSEGAFFVNLWHGVSLKRVMWQAPDAFVRDFGVKDKKEMQTSISFRIKTYSFMFRKPDLCLTPSDKQKELFFAEMFDIPLDKCVTAVYPRSKFLIEGKVSALSFIKEMEPTSTLDFVNKISKYRKVYIYMPTYRNDNRDFVKESGIDWGKLDELLCDKDSLLIVKFHPNTHFNGNEIFHQYKNICLYPAESDIYTILPFMDVLITDYSSVYSDFLMMNKDIILFVFDFDKYVKGSYELRDFDKYYIGKKVFDFPQLLKTLSSEEDCHVPKEHYDRLMDFFWSSNNSRVDIVDEIKKRINFN